jgi:hypothetical protein
MPKQTTLTTLALGAALLLVTAVRAQQKSGQSSTLTAMDYVQIQQLVARHDYALNTGAGDGYAYADLFTADGEIVKPHAQGREQLAAFARSHVKEPATANTRDFVANLVITPTPGGATGKAYMVAFNIADGAKPSVVMNGGHYEDVYVKTPAGWRFKNRDFVAKKAGGGP